MSIDYEAIDELIGGQDKADIYESTGEICPVSGLMYALSESRKENVDLRAQIDNFNRMQADYLKLVYDYEHVAKDKIVSLEAKLEAAEKEALATTSADITQYPVKMIKRTLHGEPSIICKCGEVVKNGLKTITLSMPYCGHCGKRIDDAGQSFCGWCGKGIDWHNFADALTVTEGE